MIAICERFGLDYIANPFAMPSEVKLADNRILLTERDQNMLPTSHVWGVAQAAAGAGVGPLEVSLRFWSPGEAEAQFMRTFNALTNS